MPLAAAALSRPPPDGGVRAYRARHPERTILYRALVAHLDRFVQVYEERFERTHGRLRRCVERAAHRYLDCGIFAQGAARVHCEGCGHDYLVAFSCKQRCLCPSCHQKRELLWAEWAEEEVVASLLSWRHSGFSVHAGVRVEEKAAAARLGRYMARCPIVLDRLEWEADREEVVIHPRPSRRGGPFGESERLDVLDFLARVLDHVPEPRQQQVRYWGWYSNAARGKRRKAELVAEGPQKAAASSDRDPSSRRRRLSWARLIKKVYEVDPLLCRYCGKEMRVVAFVVEVPSLRRLVEGLGLGLQEAEPLSRAPPGQGELVYEAVEG